MLTFAITEAHCGCVPCSGIEWWLSYWIFTIDIVPCERIGNSLTLDFETILKLGTIGTKSIKINLIITKLHLLLSKVANEFLASNIPLRIDWC